MNIANRFVGKLRWPLVVAGCLSPGAVMAEGNFGGFVEVATGYSDNANKTSTNELSERQDEFTLGLTSDYAFNFAELNLDYEVTRNNFDKDSQDNRTLWRGDSSLLLGSEEDIVDLLISHSRRTLLAEASAVEVLDNIEERNILLAKPTARLNITSVDTISISGIFTDVTYRLEDERDTERLGGELRWRHRLSQISLFEVSAQQVEISYPELDMGDYDYQLAWLGYETQQRKLGYRVEVGYNKTDPEMGEEADGVYINATANYGDESNNVVLSASRFITDTSTGNGNDDFFSGVGSGDIILDVQDEIERTSFNVTWNYALLCARCDLSLGLGVEIEDYNEANVADNTETLVTAKFGYRVTNASDIFASFRYRDQDFDDSSLTEFSRYNIRVEYTYNFTDQLSAGLFLRFDERQADSADLVEYEETLFGVNASYSF